jgi:hypothetical protein
MNCRNCIHWVDESLATIEADPSNPAHVFTGCRIFGFIRNTELENCSQYVESDNLFTLCNTCRIPVPKVCISLGECVNCTNTDLYCLEHCMGGDSRKYCTHFVRLRTQGVQLVNNNEVFDLFPALDMPGQGKDKTSPK